MVQGVSPCSPLQVAKPDLVPPAPFLQCEPHLTPGGSGVLADPARLMKNSERLGFPPFAALGKGVPALRNSTKRLTGGYRFYRRLLCPGCLVRCLLM